MIARSRGAQARQAFEDALNLTGSIAGRQPFLDFITIGKKAHAVALPVGEVGDAGCRHAGVTQLVAGRAVALIAHGSTSIDHQVDVQVGIFLIGLGKELSALGIDLPINQLEILSRHIGSILKKFRAAAVSQAAVQSRKQALDHQPRKQRIVFDLGQPSRIQKILIDSHEPIPGKELPFRPFRELRPRGDPRRRRCPYPRSQRKSSAGCGDAKPVSPSP